ncbi:MAG: prohibitin family protein [Acidobacteria bacterium]|nr:prohibitin family protein [Acidobacteriota bacterium]
MALLAILLLLVGLVAWRLKAKTEFPLSKQLNFVQWGAWGLGALIFLFSMAVVVPPGQAGVVVFFGSVRKEALPAGLHLINPLSRVVEMEVRTRNYTMSTVADEGMRRGDDSIAVITADGLTVKLDVSVLYSLQQERLPEIYLTLGEDVEERLIRGAIRSAIRDSAANQIATDLYAAKRQLFTDSISKSLSQTLGQRGITLEQVLLRDVKLPDQITKAINEKIAADQEAQKMTFVLQKEKQEAERKRIEAEGQARAQGIVSASLTPQILEWQRIQALKEIGAKGNLIITDGKAQPMIQVPARAH